MSTSTNPSDHDAEANLPPPARAGASAPARDAVRADTAAAVPALLWTATLAAVLAAGAATGAWAIGERLAGYYHPSQAAVASRYDFSALNREQSVANQKNAAVAFGTFGALLAATLGAFGGAMRRSFPAVVGSGLVGLFAGALCAGLAGFALAPYFARFYNDVDPILLVPVLVRGGIFAAAGVAAGGALGLGRHGPSGIPRALLGGLLGSVVGIIAFEVTNAVIFPMDRNDKLIPTSIVARLLAYLLIAAGVAVGAASFGRGGSRLGGAIKPSAHPSAAEL